MNLGIAFTALFAAIPFRIFEKKKLLAITLILNIISCALFALSQNINFLYFFRFLMGST